VLKNATLNSVKCQTQKQATFDSLHLAFCIQAAFFSSLVRACTSVVRVLCVCRPWSLLRTTDTLGSMTVNDRMPVVRRKRLRCPQRSRHNFALI